MVFYSPLILVQVPVNGNIKYHTLLGKLQVMVQHTLAKKAYDKLIAIVGKGELISIQFVVRGSDLLSIKSRHPA